MALKIIDYGSANYKKMLEIRYEILRKPLGLTFSEKELEKEKDDILIGCFEDDELEGCCLLTKQDNDTIRLRQMAVSKVLQGKGIGRVLMIFAENIARDKGFKQLTMHARNNAVGFYKKLGYDIIGNEFIEVTIPHYLMQKIL